jgi:hypothetical protein
VSSFVPHPYYSVHTMASTAVDVETELPNALHHRPSAGASDGSYDEKVHDVETSAKEFDDSAIVVQDR